MYGMRWMHILLGTCEDTTGGMDTVLFSNFYILHSASASITFTIATTHGIPVLQYEYIHSPSRPDSNVRR